MTPLVDMVVAATLYALAIAYRTVATVRAPVVDGTGRVVQ